MDLIQEIIGNLKKYSSEKRAIFAPYFFKTGEGQYGYGDKFLGISVPDTRKVAKLYKNKADTNVVAKLLANEYHEVRLLALFMLVDKYVAANKEDKKGVVDFYLNHLQFVNNWDLVDSSAYHILGNYLIDGDRAVLYTLAHSNNLWEQRVAIVSTYAFIKIGDLADTALISELLIDHKHDLIHKACGWMLREAGKRDENFLTAFLDNHAEIMPRTMLRYCIEKLSKEQKTFYMSMKK